MLEHILSEPCWVVEAERVSIDITVERRKYNQKVLTESWNVGWEWIESIGRRFSSSIAKGVVSGSVSYPSTRRSSLRSQFPSFIAQ
ncbi:uncharacterized protein N7525_011424 [Penicillium rubens]|jgi:hypothetical protein|uniref:uncharacterized protein n=1 Tax=Penicillium rubens TaxID=1108849 RepID=UPI002A5A0F3E|nr:uncharacterized protein N7525_011424 [Penicillium rubens]KAJ5822140.1 hypothetical protein N7525_011424 [Penicillium rubens]KAJ5859783.1 hypothetical protein N7534_005060 [Penicillium rubens]